MECWISDHFSFSISDQRKPVSAENKNAFLNFYEAHEIDLVYLPKEYRLKLYKNGFDPIPLIKKSKVQYREVAWTSEHDLTENDHLNQLFK